jgi:hypothetical protein
MALKKTNSDLATFEIEIVSGLEVVQPRCYCIRSMNITVTNTLGLRRRRICKVVRQSTVQVGEQLTEVIDQLGLNMLIFGADEVDVSNITPFIIYLFESPGLNG